MKKAGIYIPPGCKPWPHEIRVAEILAAAGHYVEFLVAQNNLPTPDIRLDGIEYEIKSPDNFNPNTLDHTIRKAIRQSSSLIIDISRINMADGRRICHFLMKQARKAKRLKRMLMITKQGEIIDIFKLIR